MAHSTTKINFVITCIREFKWLTTGQILVAIFWAVDLSLRPYLLKVIIDRLLNIGPEQKLDIILLPVSLYILVLVISDTMLRIENFIWLKLNSGLKCHIAQKLMDKMTAHSYTFYQNNFSGSIANKVKDVMSGVPDLSRLVINKLFSHFLALFFAVYAIWQVSSVFVLTMIPFIIIFLLGSIIVSSRGIKVSYDAAEIRSTAVGYMSDIFSNMINVWLFNTKKSEESNFSVILKKYKDADQRRDIFFIKLYSFQSICFIVYQIICLYFLITGFQNHSITPGDFALVLTLNTSLVACLSELSNDVGTGAEIMGNVWQGLEMTHPTLTIQNTERKNELVIKNGNIIFRNVEFYYYENKTLFKNLSIDIKGNQKIGLVGYSGSGKSTFVNLILQLFDATSGQILIDNQDIQKVTLNSLRKNIALIPQDLSLFHRSLMENIRYGNIIATDNEVIEASKQAYLHEFIITLPEAYNSLVGERGVKLSGGQRQRIAIARAILKNAPILILDEATSHLDSITEGYIQKSLSELMKNKTTIVIAHRLSTLLHMDRIIVFEKGKIVADGTHKMLLKSSNLYRTLWDTQVDGFLPDN
jgi:ATP-binding cassette subfamily B protein